MGDMRGFAPAVTWAFHGNRLWGRAGFLKAPDKASPALQTQQATARAPVCILLRTKPRHTLGGFPRSPASQWPTLGVSPVELGRRGPDD